MKKLIKQFKLMGIVPVIKINDAKNAVPLANALLKGGLACAEVTFRTAAAKDAIRNIAENCPEILVGAGTVLTPDQVDEAVDAGAKFIVSPGLNEEVVRCCLKKQIPVIPGVNNPAGIEQAMSLGLSAVKFFPAEQSGGISAIKAMSAPYDGVLFMPTGGINAGNICSYLDYDKVICCGGSWMVPSNLIDKGDFDGIENLVRQAVDTVLGFKFKHIGVNSQDPVTAAATANYLNEVFSFGVDKRSASIFSSPEIEIMYCMGRGLNGHVGIYTHNVARAVYHLGLRGVEFDMSTATFDEKGEIKFVYIKNDINGFAYHLVH